MLSLDHISVRFGDRVLFSDVRCVINPRDRIGLVGSNGAGKTTLLRIIAGLATPDGGTLSKARFVTTGYLPQDGMTVSGRSLFDEAQSAFQNVLDVERELREAHDALAALDPGSREYGEMLEISGELQHTLEDLDAFRMKSKVERVLMGLGFSTADFHRLTDEFSGGWQMRIALAKLLLKEPSVLLLDEPTNHLDLETLQWLEEYLRSYNGAVVLVSHDRAFLDALCSRTLALEGRKVVEYAGNYSFYEQERELRRESALNASKNQQLAIKQTQAFIDRFRYKASKAQQVQSRIKRLEKLELVEIEAEEKDISFGFPPAPSAGRIVLDLKDLRKSYGGKTIFAGLDLRIERGDRIAVVGLNGAGKSTLARIAAGIEPIDAGERIIGHNVTISYYAQHQAEELDPSKEVLAVVDEVAEGEIRKRLRALLGMFLFHGDDVFKRVGVLSGGERSRLALAMMLLRPANFLIMDEPTNHLDMRSKRVLQEALKDFGGAFLIVSHDRAFLEPLVNKVLEVKERGLKTHLGSMDDYLRKKKEERASSVGEELGSRRAPGRVEANGRRRRREEAERRQEQSRRLRPLKQQLAALEDDIERLEARRSGIEKLMATPEFYKSGPDARALVLEHKEILDTLEGRYRAWNALVESVEHIERGG